MENSVVEAGKSADAARKGAEISELAMIAGNRAYVHYNSFRWISHFDRKNNWYFWRLHPRWINSGNTPTRGLEVRVAYELRDAPLPETFDFRFPESLQVTPTTIYPSGMIESMPRDITGEELVAIRDGKKHFYVWGVARYHDVFPGTPRHVTKFCCSIGNVTGNPREGYDVNSNAVEITFPFYHRHNCADDDCQDQRKKGA